MMSATNPPPQYINTNLASPSIIVIMMKAIAHDIADESVAPFSNVIGFARFLLEGFGGQRRIADALTIRQR